MMVRPVVVLLLLIAPVALPLGAGASTIVPPPEGDPTRLLVAYETPLAPEARLAMAAHDARIVAHHPTLGADVLEVDALRSEALQQRLRAIEGVQDVREDLPVRAQAVPLDPYYPLQWGPSAIHVPEVWDSWKGSHETVVAVIDTGVAYDHPDLEANICTLGPDYVNGDEDPYDDQYHGTHVAGTVAAELDNLKGVAGMANACIMPIKVLDENGHGWFSDLVEAVVWATDHGADIISMSLGGCPGCDPGPLVERAMAYAEERDVLVVAAAGNASCDEVGYPAAYPTVIAVAALTAPGEAAAGFSSCGPEVEVAAPGDQILSTFTEEGALVRAILGSYPGDETLGQITGLLPVEVPVPDDTRYTYLSGTSMATPHVSGVAALIWSAHPDLSARTLRCALWQTADDLAEEGHDNATGFGRIHAKRLFDRPVCDPVAPTQPDLDAASGDGAAVLWWQAPWAWGDHPITGYDIFRGTSEAELQQRIADEDIYAALPGDQHRFEDTDVAIGESYHYALRAHNDGGASDPDVQAVTIQAAATAPGPFRFESDLEGWTTEGLWHRTTDRAGNGTGSVYFGQENGPGLEDNSYETGTPHDAVFRSPPIHLGGTDDARLDFWSYTDVQGGPDHVELQVVSMADPHNGTTLMVLEGRDHEEAYQVDLSEHVGQTVWLQFRFVADEVYIHHEGVYLDEIHITRVAPDEDDEDPDDPDPSGFSLVQPGFTDYAGDPALIYVHYVPPEGATDPVVEARADGEEWVPLSGPDDGYWIGGIEGLAEGQHLLEVRANAVGANETTVTRNFTVDTQDPQLAVDRFTSVDACTVTLSGTAVDEGPAGISLIEVTIDGRSLPDVSPDASGAWSIEADLTGLRAGTHHVVVTARDAAFRYDGGVEANDDTKRFSFHQERDCIPTLTIDSPSAGATVRGLVDVTGNVSWPTQEIGYLNAEIDGDRLAWTQVDGTYTMTIPTMSFDDGPHLLTVSACTLFQGYCTEVDLAIATDHTDRYEEAGDVTCATVDGPYVWPVGEFGDLANDCGTSYSYTADPMLTTFRATLTWEEGPLVEFDDLALIVKAPYWTWEARGEYGDTLVIQGFGMYSDEPTDLEVSVEASGHEIIDVAVEQDYELTMEFAYWGHHLPT